MLIVQEMRLTRDRHLASCSHLEADPSPKVARSNPRWPYQALRRNTGAQLSLHAKPYG